MTPFLARIAVLQAQSPVTLPIPTHAPVRADYSQAVAPDVTPKQARRLDVAQIVEEMGEWCDETHELPDLLALEL